MQGSKTVPLRYGRVRVAVVERAEHRLAMRLEFVAA